MADEMVLRAQRFVNETYGSVIGMTVEENGQTGWNTMYALTRALQYELGISALSNSFGPTTLSTLGSKYPSITASTALSENFCRIIQAGLYCKGYDGGGIDGAFSSRVEASLTQLKADMGVDQAYPGSALTPKVFKGLLNMDAYVTVNGGSGTVRGVQQWLNGRFVDRQDFYIIPCDGHHSRDVAKSMLFAIQYSLGMADGVANGVFGPGTQSGLRDHTVSTGSTGVWVQLFSAGMVLNQRPVSFTSTFTSALASAVSDFQSFAKLPVTGSGNFSTWASLLVSYGDQDRNGEACDGVTRITAARAQSLKAAGIKYVGRYLTNPSTTSLPEKAIQPGELQTIADNGLRCFPIYQTYGRDADGFTYPSGRAAGQAAVNAALDHGFKRGTRIFFAVDFDALDYQVTDNVLPYFKGIVDAIANNGSVYEVGVYGPRNVCTRVGEAGHATASFVSDMSSGFSGNFGYPLPANWAYDQIVTRTIGSGTGSINIDVNIASGRDTGQGSFDPPASQAPDVLFDTAYWPGLLADVQNYMESIGFAESDGRIYTTTQCLETIIACDLAVTNTARAYGMRKALIQATSFWEFRHYGNEDLGKDAGVWLYHNGYIPDWAKDLPEVDKLRDSSTGVAQMFGFTGICAWNNSIRRGLVTGTPKDTAKDADIFSVWDKLRTDNDFALTSVGHAHMWAADGKPGGDEEEPMSRLPTLDYTDSEIYEVLRRYQGPAEPAFTDARKRMPLYYIFEKYNRMMR
ncbi:glycoside hydrolase domain-containing protein [Streptomyces sp. LaPpAH-108]|uniref:glycoside hydrolase domain-containing protein n=1 Tax=Streptomyces sp. LaPpAH-108 TaxID=1155714 RepID=UPI00039C2F52|nr:glycoside hydrolase domain-containing protein [Streptomyces sp. LaPpAH-108]